MKDTFRLLAIVFSLLPPTLRAADPAPVPPVARAARAAGVLLAFDGSGDFGPQTPGTRTDGWQEALDCCVREARDLHVLGGFGGRKPISTTVVRDDLVTSDPCRYDMC